MGHIFSLFFFLFIKKREIDVLETSKIDESKSPSFPRFFFVNSKPKR